MGHQFSLAHLTVLGCSPPEMIHIAARAGFDFVSLRLIPLGLPGEAPSLTGNSAMIQKTREALETTGIKLLDIELARITRDADPKAYVPAFEVAEELGARHVISSAWTTDRSDRDFIVDRYGEICDLARPFGLSVELEFPTISRLASLEEAVDIVRAADRPNCGILLDTLYIHFSRVKQDDLSLLPRNWLHFLHICDAPLAIPSDRNEMIRIVRDDRLYLGEGCIDFPSIFKRLPSIPYAIELPNARRVKELGFEGHARRCLETARHYLERHLETAE